MRTISRIILGTILAALLPAVAGLPVVAQQGQQGQQPPPKPPVQPGQTPPPAPPATPLPGVPETPPMNKEEEDAYKAFLEVKREEWQHQLQLGEEFLTKFPESRYRESVYSKLAGLYLNAGQEEKMFTAGEKALELNPDNVDVLALMGWAVPRRTQPGSLDADQRLTKSDTYSKRAIELLTNMVKPANFTDEDFTKAKNEKLSMCHSGLGVVHYYRRRYPEMVTAMEQATKLSANADPTDFYLLGLGYQETKRFEEAVAAYGRCAETPGGLQANCKQGREQAKMQAQAAAAQQPAPPKP